MELLLSSSNPRIADLSRRELEFYESFLKPALNTEEPHLILGFITDLDGPMPPESQVRKLAKMNHGKLPKYVWPGGYAICYRQRLDGRKFLLCGGCATHCIERVRSGQLVGWYVNYADAGPDCAACHTPIESIGSLYGFR
jgi:hypothetical protein